jgi:hypothetical protein
MADGTANNRNTWQTAGTSRTLTGALLLLLAVGDLLHSPLTPFGWLAVVVTTPATPDEEEGERDEGSSAVPRTLTRGHPGVGRLPRKLTNGPRPSPVTSDGPFRLTTPAPFSPAHPKQNGLGAPLRC